MPWKTGWGGGGGWAQSNFPTCDHQNIFNLILTYIYIFIYFGKYLGGGGTASPLAPIGTTAMYWYTFTTYNFFPHLNKYSEQGQILITILGEPLLFINNNV